MKERTAQPLIRIRDLHYTYQEESQRAVHALNGIDLVIHEGEYVTLIGANGSGKSTLLKHLNALLLPSKGEVVIRQWNTRNLEDIRNIRSTVGMVFQSPDTQIIATVVEEDVAFGPENIGVPEEELGERVEQALEAVGLKHLSKRPSHLLSAGQKQLLSIASALSMKPRCLVFDEATSMLDPASRRRFIDTVSKLHQQGITIVSATHNMDEAAIAQRVVVLSEGRIAMQGSPSEVFAQKELLTDLKLEVPISMKLAERISELLSGFPQAILTVPELVHTVDSYLGQRRSSLT